MLKTIAPFRIPKISGPIWMASDVHLNESTPVALDLFCSLLKSAAKKSNTLFLLGDIFDFWIGDDIINNSPYWLNIVLHQIKKTASQIPVWIARGNKDFLIGQKLASTLGIQILSDVTVLKSGIGDIAITHGDEFCTKDKQYQRFRSIVRNPKWQEKFLEKSVYERINIFNRIRKISSKRIQKKTVDMMDVDQKTIESFFREIKVDFLVHGHTHNPGHHFLEIDGRNYERLVLPDWNFDSKEKIKSGGYLTIGESGIQQISLSPNWPF